jgi:phage FluMu gp28-like protein
MIQAASSPAVLLGYQQEWVADTADVAVWEKSRRIGASWCDAADSVLTSARAGGMDSLYIGYSEDMTREYIDDCAMWARNFDLAAGAMNETVYADEDRDIKAFRIDYASGLKTLALSSRPRSIRGKQGKVTIDEAGFHDDLDGLLTAALALLIWGGKVRILSSHNGEDNAFNLLVKDIRAGKFAYSLHRTTFEDALRAGLYERVKFVQGERLKERTEAAWREKIYGLYGDRARQELDCIPSAGSGVYIPRTLVERCQDASIPVLRWTKPPEWVLDENRLTEARKWILDNLKPVIDAMPPNKRTVLGSDFGRSGDLSVNKVLQQDTPAAWRTAFSLELRCIPFDVQAMIRDYLLDELPLLHHAKFDARGNGQSHAEGAQQKIGATKVECVMLSQTWYATNFPPYRQAFEDRSLTVPGGEDEIADHRRIVLNKGIPKVDDGHDKGSDGGQRHGDSAVAGVLAWAATRVEGQPAFGVDVEAQDDDYLPESMSGRRRIGGMFR